MKSKWKMVKDAVQLSVYVGANNSRKEKSREFGVGSETDGRKNRDSSASPLSSFDFSFDLHSSVTSENKVTATKDVCAICLGPLIPGHGDAIFTAECSHTFHFHCITECVKVSSKRCPICRSKWKEIPFRIPLSHGSNHSKNRRFTSNNGLMIIIRPLPLSKNQNSRPSNEPEVFSDDEEIEQVKNGSSRHFSTENSEKIEVRVVPEFPALMRSSLHNNFSVLIHVKAPLCANTNRASIDLVTVLDVSGSMAGRKLALLKRAMCFVVQNLGSSDRLSLVVLSSSARRVFPLRRMTQIGKNDALKAIDSLSCSGGTDIANGLVKAAEVISGRRWTNQRSSIMLLSDGHDTLKNRGNAALVPESLLKSSIPVHSFGFGSGHETEAMHSISEISGGTFSFIEEENTIQDAFALRVVGLLSIVAQRLRVKVRCSHPKVQISSLNAGRYPTTLSETAGKVDVGDLYAEEEIDILLSLDIPVVKFSGTMSLINVECSYTDPITKRDVYLEANTTSVDRPDFIDEQKVSIEVDRQRNRLLVSEAIACAMVEAEKGNMHRARMVLSCCRRSLFQSAGFKAGDKMCVSLCEEMKEMEERMSSRHYESSRRAYMLSGLTSHSQRAITRGGLSESRGAMNLYQTASMARMISRSTSMGSPKKM